MPRAGLHTLPFEPIQALLLSYTGSEDYALDGPDTSSYMNTVTTGRLTSTRKVPSCQALACQVSSVVETSNSDCKCQ